MFRVLGEMHHEVDGSGMNLCYLCIYVRAYARIRHACVYSKRFRSQNAAGYDVEAWGDTPRTGMHKSRIRLDWTPTKPSHASAKKPPLSWKPSTHKPKALGVKLQASDPEP